ncbi:MAG TPA: hypothetical protein VH596_09690 [Terriglobales bacterium]|jgi:hypothetical protein
MSLTAPNLAAPELPPPSSGFRDLVLSARVELYACVQLLADRARFLTGATWAAIALREETKFIYRGASGEHAPEIDTEAGVKPGAAIELHPAVQSRGKFLVVRIGQESKTEGIFQVVSTRPEFSKEDVDAVVRLAEMVRTAIEHMHAAEQSEEVILTAATERLQREISRSWHAPQGSEFNSATKSGVVKPLIPANVKTCESCGFPVSHGRTICVDCEERGSRPASRLFVPQADESWISVHGYTLASLLVTALAAALIYWLR